MTERASRDNLFAASAELLFGAGKIAGISTGDSLEDSEWQPIGIGYDPSEDPLGFPASAGTVSDSGLRGPLIFSDLSDYGILDDDASDEPEAEDGEELIEPLQAEALDITVDVEADAEEAAPLEEETEADDEDLLNSDDDKFSLDAGLADEEADSTDLLPEEPDGVNFVGTDGDDVFVGSALTDILDGREGDDVLTGLAGKDYLIGYDGNDTLFGGNGDDQLHGGAGADMVYGGDGADVIHCSAGNDTLYGGEGEDLFLWRRGDGDDLVIEESQSLQDVFRFIDVRDDEVRIKELTNGDWQLIIASSSPEANDGGVITFQAGSICSFGTFQFSNTEWGFACT